MIQKFSSDRDWDQFHTPKNLAMALSVEASELVEIFQWSATTGEPETFLDGKPHPSVSEEVADIMIYLIRFADIAGIDIETAVLEKISKNAIKYPVDASKGSSKKYDKLPKL